MFCPRSREASGTRCPKKSARMGGSSPFSSLDDAEQTTISNFNWAYQQELLDADPTAKLEAIPIGERHPHPLTEKQVEAILAAIPRHDVRNRLLVTLRYETGMRVGEAL